MAALGPRQKACVAGPRRRPGFCSAGPVRCRDVAGRSGQRHGAGADRDRFRRGGAAAGRGHAGRPGRRDRARARGVGMIFPTSHVRVLVATRPVDFRKGHDGLAALVQSVLKEDPFTGTVFVFRPKRADRLKILFWDGTGLVMAYKRLEDTTFTWPAIQDGAMTLNHAQFEALFSGLDWRKVKALEVRRPGSVRAGYGPRMSATLDDLDLSVLSPEYRAAFEALQAKAARVAELEEITQQQAHLIAEMNQALHGKKSEKLSEDERQLAFEELETALAEVEEQKAEASDDKPRQKRKKGKRKSRELPDTLPRIEEVIEPDSLEWSPLERHWSERQCPCGCGLMHKIGEDRSTRIDIIPAQHRVIETIRPKYACRVCTDGVTQVPAPARLIEGGLPTEAFIAHVLVSKYADHLPLYRQSQILARGGIDIHRLDPCRLGRGRILPSEAGRRPSGRASEAIHQALHGRNHSAGAGPWAREDEDRLSLGAGPRRSIMGRRRPARGRLLLRPRAPRQERRNLPDRLRRHPADRRISGL